MRTPRSFSASSTSGDFRTERPRPRGRSGWVTIKVQPDEAPPLALIKEWIDESYRAIAPKKLIKELDAGS